MYAQSTEYCTSLLSLLLPCCAVWLSIVLAPARAQFAKQVIEAGFYNQPINSTTVARAAALAATKLPAGSTASAVTDIQSEPVPSDATVSPEFYQSGVQLPSCPSSRVLLTDEGVPENWGDLSAEEQAVHPANALMIQLAYAGVFAGCRVSGVVTAAWHLRISVTQSLPLSGSADI